MSEPRFRFRREHLAWRVVGDEAVVLDLRTKRIYFLNYSGARLWQRLASGGSVEELAAELAEPLERYATAVVGDVSAFVARLIELDLLQFAEDDESASTPPPSAAGTVEYFAPQITREDIAFFAGLGCGKSSPTTFECTRALRDS